jgi:6-hydroxytryprostatin B O-methyltransferase
MDLEMMTNFNAKERGLDDWRSLFIRGDPKLKVKKVNKPPGSVNSVIEAGLLEEVE